MISRALNTLSPPAPPQPVYLIHFLLASLLAVAATPPGRPASAEAQVIRLRQPLLRERLQNIFATSDNDQRPVGAAGPTPVPLPPPVPLSLANALAAESRSVIAANNNNHSSGQQHPQPQPSPKPGNILVHLGEDQEIERLEYMLKDGRLATVYKRHRDDQPNEKRQDPQYGPSGQPKPPGAGPASARLVLPPFRGEAIHLHAPQTEADGGGQQSQSVHTIDLNDDDNLDENGASEHSSRDLSALVLGPKLPVPGGGVPLPLPGGGYPPPVEPVLAAKKLGKLAKAKKFMKKMKPAIVMSKLLNVPKMIATKLAAKSLVGAVALDGAAGATVPLVQHHGNRFSWSRLDGGHAPAGGSVGAVNNIPAPAESVLQPSSTGIGVGTLVSPPGSSNVVRLESASSSSYSSASSFGEPMSHHELRSE